MNAGGFAMMVIACAVAAAPLAGAAAQDLPAVRDLWESFRKTLPPLDPVILKDEVVASDTDPRLQIRRIEVLFHSQEIDGRKWGHPSVVFAPADPAVNAASERRGKVVIVGQRSVDGLATGPWRGSYLGNYGEPIAARTGYPTMIVPVPGEYDDSGGREISIGFLRDRLNATKDVREHSFFRLAVPYLRALDVLAGILGEARIRAVIGGHSKRATSALTAAAMDPERIAGVVYMGNESTFDNYSGTFQEAISPYRSQKALKGPVLYIGATNEDGYEMFAVNRIVARMEIPWTVEIVPNYRHSAQSEKHYIDWQMFVAHVFDGRPITKIRELAWETVEGGTRFRAHIDSPNKIIQVEAWYTYCDDVPYWRDLAWYSEFLFDRGDGLYEGFVPGKTPDAYLIEVKDTAQGFPGYVTSLPQKITDKPTAVRRSRGSRSRLWEPAPPPPAFFSPQGCEANEDCRWILDDSPLLRMNDHYIAGPPEGGDRAAWLAALARYRERVRDGAGGRLIRMEYRGVRAWIRVAPAIAKALDLRAGETLQVSLDARSIEGNREVCIAFDIHNREDDRKVGWSTVRSTLALPDDRDWHRVTAAVSVPPFDREKQWLRPIIGMDGTHDPKPGKVEIRDIALRVEDAARIEAIAAAVRALPPARRLDRSIYDRPDLAWMARAFACHFTFMYDRGFYDAEKGEYTLDSFLDDGQSFGGYDAIVLWQGYPRLGVDERNQFDMYRDMPGGLPGLGDLIRRAHDRGVKVFIDYNPWDTGTRREPKGDEEALADLVAAIEADGIFLDTMSATSPSLRERLDEVRPGVVLAPEGHPVIAQLPYLSASWGQGLNDPAPPGLLHLKWIEPRHMQHQIKRWDRSHAGEIETAFFNGSGILIWENIFGTYNPWPSEDAALWEHAVRILRHFAANFASDRWDPLYPTRAKGLFANRFPGDPPTVFTLLNRGDPIREKPLIAVRAQAGKVFYDLWNGRRMETRRSGDETLVSGSIDRLGCILEIPESAVDIDLGRLIDAQRAGAASLEMGDPRVGAGPVVRCQPVARTKLARRADPPAGMVFVPRASIRIRIEHMARECGCYPDPGTPEEKWPEFLWGNPHNRTIRHDYGPVEIKPFFIDEAEVTNAEFKRFLDAAGYRPEHPENFLKHWPDGKMPAEIADLPVVYVDLDDARAYARWADKRLPTEEEWQLAAQGTDGRTWPWGDTFDPARANTTGRMMPSRTIPEGRSPYGCYHMAGNVWEWTESARDDGYTRFVMIRGGSFFKAEGSIWYVPGGPQPCTSHAKFIRMWPGLDRCSTIGFRCVVDAAE